MRVLGEQIRRLRQERGLTLQALAQRAGVSLSMVSAVEHGEKAPTIIVLDKIATGLRTRLVDLLAAPAEPRVIVRRASEQDVVEEPAGWRRVILTPVIPGVNFELIRSTLPPGCDPGEYPAYAPGSHEYVTVDTGTLRLSVGDTTMQLDTGDSVYFAADAPHRYTNPTDTPCTYYVATLIARPRTPQTQRHHHFGDRPATGQQP